MSLDHKTDKEMARAAMDEAIETRKPQANQAFQSAVVDLNNALMEWKDAGGNSLDVVAAIQRFVYAATDKPV